MNETAALEFIASDNQLDVADRGLGCRRRRESFVNGISPEQLTHHSCFSSSGSPNELNLCITLLTTAGFCSRSAQPSRSSEERWSKNAATICSAYFWKCRVSEPPGFQYAESARSRSVPPPSCSPRLISCGQPRTRSFCRPSAAIAIDEKSRTNRTDPYSALHDIDARS